MTNEQKHAKFLKVNDMVAVAPVVMLDRESEIDYKDNGDGTWWMFTGRIAQLCRMVEPSGVWDLGPAR